MSVADDDVAIAVINRWNTDGQLPLLVPGGLVRGREIAAVTANAPYAVLTVSQGPTANDILSGVAYVDYRHVTIEIRGLYEAVRDALAQVSAAFDWATLTVPGAANFGRCKPLYDRDLEEDPATKQGESIWIGHAEYEVMSTRLYGT